MRLSIVSTLYGSSPYVDEFHQRASVAARQLVGSDYEIVLVNDGSLDDSLKQALRLAESDPRLGVVDLSRNFGHHKAMMTGLAHARGELVFLIDSDLEEEPEWLLPFHQQLRADGSDVVFGVQGRRRGETFERLSGKLFYGMFRLLTGVAQPDDIITARLMSRRYVDALVAHRERELNIGGLWVTTGFAQSRRIVHKRSSSLTTYTFSKKITHFVNAVTSFSSLPLVLIFYSGAFISSISLIYILYLFFRYFFISEPPEGYTSIIASIWLSAGLIIFFLGIQGIYISKIFSEVKQRPYTIVRHVYRGASRTE
jgi:putative glycosyltransferase